MKFLLSLAIFATAIISTESYAKKNWKFGGNSCSWSCKKPDGTRVSGVDESFTGSRGDCRDKASAACSAQGNVMDSFSFVEGNRFDGRKK
jgi:hypothetical protein